MAYIGQVKINDSGISLPIGSTLYGTCSTSANIQKKDVALINNATIANLITGTTIHVKFTNTNTASSPQLVINGTEIPITNVGNTQESSWRPNAVVAFTYDGTNWVVNSAADTNTWTKLSTTSVGYVGAVLPDDEKQFLNGEGKWSELPVASESQSGIVSTSEQKFAGMKFFKKNIAIIDEDQLLLWASDTNTRRGGIWMKSVNNKKWLPERMYFRQYRYNTSTEQPYQNSWEQYRLPTITHTNGTVEYDILTSKNTVTVEQGGTGVGSDGFTKGYALIGNGTGPIGVKQIETAVSDNENLITSKAVKTAISALKADAVGVEDSTKYITKISQTDGKISAILSTKTIGSETEPVYIKQGTITKGNKYAGGTRVTLNSEAESTGSNEIKIYAPTEAGTSNYVLVSSGDNKAPVWTAQTALTGILQSFTSSGNTITVKLGGSTKEAKIINSISNTWAGGNVEGPTLVTTVNDVSSTAAAIPSASSDASGIVTTGEQGFSGKKTFNGEVYFNSPVYNTATNGLFYFSSPNANARRGAIFMNTGKTNNVERPDRLYFRHYSYNSTTGAAITGAWDQYRLPAATSDLSSSTSYDILTSKYLVSVSQGGTGRSTFTTNAVVIGNGANSLEVVSAANGAFYSTGANVKPQFGTLPIAQGGTGGTSIISANNSLKSRTLGYGTTLSQGTDLNTITAVGNYCVPYTKTAQTILNTPRNTSTDSTTQAFILIVETPVGIDSKDYMRQIYQEYNNMAEWVRWSTNGGSTWSSWYVRTTKAGYGMVGDSTTPVYVNANGTISAITSYSGNAATATSAAKLTTARSLTTNLASTTAVTFDGSAAQDSIPVKGILPIANGGTGASTVQNASTNLGILYSLDMGELIASNSNLNNSTIGKTFYSTSSISSTLTNAPTTEGFKLFTFKNYETNRLIQVAFSNVYHIYRRARTNATSWMAWVDTPYVTANTQIGSTSTPVYVKNTGEIAAISYSISASVSAGTANKLAYYSAANTISSASLFEFSSNNTLYCNSGQIHIMHNDSAGNKVGLISYNGSNLWIGATQGAIAHHAGSTYISTGYNTTSKAGNKYISMAIPKDTNDSFDQRYLAYKETGTSGSTTQPVYFDGTLGLLKNASTYAGGTALTLNGTSKGGATAAIYAPTEPGTSGQVLTSNGSGEPEWKTISTNVPIASYNNAGIVKVARHHNQPATYAGGFDVDHISIQSITSNSDRYYAVEADSNGILFVNVPWVSGSGGTSYFAGNGISISNNQISLKTSGVTAGTYYSSASDSTLGGSDVFYVPKITVDSYGRITGISNIKYTLNISSSGVTSITLKGGGGISINSESAITSSGTRTITNTGVRSISAGPTNGTLSVNINGSPTTITAVDTSKFAASSHTHDYLPLSGGTVAGATTFNAAPTISSAIYPTLYLDSNTTRGFVEASSSGTTTLWIQQGKNSSDGRRGIQVNAANNESNVAKALVLRQLNISEATDNLLVYHQGNVIYSATEPSSNLTTGMIWLKPI